MSHNKNLKMNNNETASKKTVIPDWILVTPLSISEKIEFEMHRLTTMIPVCVTFFLFTYLMLFYTQVSHLEKEKYLSSSLPHQVEIQAYAVYSCYFLLYSLSCDRALRWITAMCHLRHTGNLTKSRERTSDKILSDMRHFSLSVRFSS